MHRLRCTTLLLVLLGILFGCTSTHDDSQPCNPFDPRCGEGLPVPDSIVVQLGNNAVRLSWSLPDSETVDEFAIFRRRIDTEPPSPWGLLARLRARIYTDRGVHNGHAYEYRIASGRDGQFGPRSEPVQANPGVYSIVIADDAPKTASRSVQVFLNAPGAEAVQLSEDPDSVLSSTPRRIAASVGWTLSLGDGNKSLYGVFRLVDGSESMSVFDDITLDTQAAIDSVGFDGSGVLRPGDPIHFWLVAGEPGGRAFVSVTGLFTNLQLYDDGSNGDRAPGNGVYERDIDIPAGPPISLATVTGQFADDVGNQTTLASSRSITVSSVPAPVQLTLVELAQPPDPPGVTLRWTQSTATTDFAAYRLLRSETAPVEESSPTAGTVNSRTTLEFTDRNVVEGRDYYYRVFVTTTTGLQAGSNPVQVSIPNLRPPQQVTLQEADAVAETRVSLRWSQELDKDFRAYRVHRNEAGAVTETDLLVDRISDVTRTFLDDSGLIENTEYHYRVIVLDTDSLTSRSNEITVMTRNQAPDAVRLLDPLPGDIGRTEATLTWDPSPVHDFAAYRLYRSTTSSVSQASTHVVTIEEPDAISFRDTGLATSTEYWYRVFVVDDGADSLATGSNTIHFTTLE